MHTGLTFLYQLATNLFYQEKLSTIKYKVPYKLKVVIITVKE